MHTQWVGTQMMWILGIEIFFHKSRWCRFCQHKFQWLRNHRCKWRFPAFDTPCTHGSGINVECKWLWDFGYGAYWIVRDIPWRDRDCICSQLKAKNAKAKARERDFGVHEEIFHRGVEGGCYIKDPVVGSGQKVRMFQERIVEAYNMTKPTWAWERDWDNLRKHGVAF